MHERAFQSRRSRKEGLHVGTHHPHRSHVFVRNDLRSDELEPYVHFLHR